MLTPRQRDALAATCRDNGATIPRGPARRPYGTLATVGLIIIRGDQAEPTPAGRELVGDVPLSLAIERLADACATLAASAS